MRVQVMLAGGPYHGAIMGVTDPDLEIRIAVFEHGMAVLYRREGEVDDSVRGMAVASYNFVDCIESADSLNLPPPKHPAKLGEYDPAFLVLTKEEKRRRRHGKRTFRETEEENDYGY